MSGRQELLLGLAVPPSPEEIPLPEDRFAPPADKDERPSVFIRVWLTAVLLLIAVSVTLFVFACVLSPAREVPDYRWASSYRDYPVAVVAQGPGGDVKILWVGTLGGGIQRFDPRTLFWEPPITRENTEGGLPTDYVAGLDITGDRIGYVCEEDGRRGLTFSAALPRPVKNQFWARPFLDFTHLGQDTGDTLSCVAKGAHEGLILLGSSRAGIGHYDRASRRWLETMSKAAGQIGDDRVHDLHRWTGGILVAHDLGLDLCRDNQGHWQRLTTVTGLGSRGVARLYPLEELPSGLDLWCVTIGNGVAAMIVHADGAAENKITLISERAVRDLTLEACRNAAYDENTNRLWVAFKQGGGLGLARYRFADHDWLGTTAPLGARHVFCLGTDQQGTGLAGTEDGVWQAWEHKDTGLESAARGPEREKVTEIASAAGFIWAHTQWAAPAPQARDRIRAVPPQKPEGDEPWPWRDLIGPRRFPGLQDADLLCAARCGQGGKYYFGTMKKGIGVYIDGSHEIAPAHLEPPDSTILDLACTNEKQILAVTGGYGLALYDGQSWSGLISPATFAARPEHLAAAASHAQHLFVGADPLVGRYDMTAHTWTALPNLPGVKQFQATADRLWGLNKGGDLSAVDHGAGQGGPWQTAARDVVAFRAGRDLLAALSKPGDKPRQLLFSQAGTPELVVKTAPKPFGPTAGMWRNACVDGTTLYLASDQREVAQYDLTSHHWEKIPWPNNVTGSKKLEATRAGLWMLTESDDLRLWDREKRTWIELPVCTAVESLTFDGADLLALRRPDAQDAEPNRLVKITGNSPPTVLIGRPLDKDMNDARAAAGFGNALFLGSTGRISRYKKTNHDWRNYELPPQGSVKLFAPTTRFLYALVPEADASVGDVMRYDPAKDNFEPLLKTAGDPDSKFKAQRLAADGKQMAALQQPRSDVFVVPDADPNTPTVVYPSSRAELDHQEVRCAAENGPELYLGDSKGRVLAYAWGQDNLPRWTAWTAAVGAQPNNDSAAPGSAVRRLFFTDDNTFVVVTEDNIYVNSRPAAGQSWKLARSVLKELSRCDAWKAAEGDLFYAAATSEADKKARCYSHIGLTAPKGDSDKRTMLSQPLSTATMPLGPTAAVAEWKTARDVLLFRAGADGELWRYVMSSHGWSKEPVEPVKQLFVSLGKLWAYAPASMALYELSSTEDPPVWKPYANGAKIADLAADPSGLLLRHEDGRVELLEHNPAGEMASRTLAMPVPAKMQAETAKINAYAESGSMLFCSFGEAATYSYDWSKHSWQPKLDAGVRRFLKAGQTLYSVLFNGSLKMWDPAGNAGVGAFTDVATPAPLQQATMVEGRLCITTIPGGMYLQKEGGQWQAVVDPSHRLEGTAWAPVTAAAEADGRLVLGLKEAAGGSVAVYDPATGRWQKAAIPPDCPERIFSCGGKLMVVCSGGDGVKRVYHYDAAQNQLQPVADKLCSVTRSGEELWWLSESGSIEQLDPTTMKPRPGLEICVALPVGPDAQLRDLLPVGDELAAGLSDGSIWHRSGAGKGWKQVRPKSTVTNFSRQLHQIGGFLVTSEPDGSILVYDATKGDYIALPRGQAPPTPPRPARWKVEKNPVDGNFKVCPSDSDKWTPVINGRLPIDDFKRLAVDADNVYVETAAGTTRGFRRKDSQDISSSLTAAQQKDRFTQEPGYVFDGKYYSSVSKSAQAAGTWKTADGKDLQITRKAVPGLDQGMILRPYAANDQLGLATQWVRSVAVQGDRAMAAYPGGVLLFRLPGLALDKPCHLADDQTAPELAVGKTVYCRLAKERLLAFDPSTGQSPDVQPTERNAVEEAFRDAGVRGRNALGPTWSLQTRGSDLDLMLTTGDQKQQRISCDQSGFGFDRVAGMTLGGDVIVCYTPDGAVRYGRKDKVPGGVPLSIDPAMTVPGEAIKIPCRTITGFQDYTVVLLARDETRAWGWRATGWAAVDTKELLKPIAGGGLLDGRYCKWDRSEKVRLHYPEGEALAPGKEIKTGFDAASGRFGVDQVLSIAAWEGQCWGITRSGICRFGDRGAWEIYLNEDPSYDWGKTDKENELAVVKDVQGKKETLCARLASRGTGTPAWLAFDGSAWKLVPPGSELRKSLDDHSERLLDGQQWKVKASEINAQGKRVMHRHWPWQKPQDFMEVSLDPAHSEYPGTFDFERINDLVFHNAELWLATDCGVVRVNPQSRQVLGLTVPGSERQVAQIIRTKTGAVYSKAGAKVFHWDDQTGHWALSSGTDPFASTPVLFDGEQWRVEQPGSSLKIMHRLAQADPKPSEVSLVADQGRFRFNFDAVTAVAAEQTVAALVSKRGLIERIGPGLEDVKRADMTASAGASQLGEVFAFGPKEDQKLYFRQSGTLLEHDRQSGRWTELDASRRREVERSFVRRPLAWNERWYVSDTDGVAKPMVKLPKDPRHTLATYKAQQGLFSFDIFHDVAVCDTDGQSGTDVFLATDGGIVQIDRDGTWQRRYADEADDGLSDITITQLAGTSTDDLMACDSLPGATGRSYYKLAADKKKWAALESSAEAVERFARLRSTVCDDPQAWRVIDLGEYRGQRQASGDSSPRFSFSWKGEPVWFLDAEAKLVCAHDVAYGVEVYKDEIWAGTAGGCVCLPTQPAGDRLTIDRSGIRLYAKNFIAGYDPWSPPSPRSVGVLKVSQDSGELTAFLLPPGRRDDAEVDPQNSYEYDPARGAFAAVSDKARAAAALKVIDDRFWYWKKLGPRGLAVQFHPGRADVPDSYARLGNGTFRFYDVTCPPGRKPRQRSMVRCLGRLFLLTAGGVMSFDEKTCQPDTLYALADSGAGSSTQSLEDLDELYFARTAGILYARKGRSVFAFSGSSTERNEAGRAWKEYQGPDPFLNADVLVENDLLKWRQRGEVAKIELPNSDLPPGVPYDFFTGGKFSFDHVRTLAFQGDKVCLATAGGVVEVDRKTRKILFIHARAFLPENRPLPDIREIVYDGKNPAPEQRRLYARDGMRDCYALEAKRKWEKLQETSNANAAFHREYTRVEDDFWTWVQPPDSVYVQLHKTVPENLNIGGAAPGAHSELMSRGRLVWDDLREALLLADELLMTTPAGVCRYTCDLSTQRAAYQCLYGRARGADNSEKPMTGLERLITDGEDLLTWNQHFVFRGRRSGGDWHWEVDPALTPQQVSGRKLFVQGDTRWLVEAADSSGQVCVRQMHAKAAPDEQGQQVLSAAAGKRESPDLSRAVKTEDAIWYPSSGELIQLDLSMAQAQSRCRLWAWIALGIAAGGLVYLFSLAGRNAGKERERAS